MNTQRQRVLIVDDDPSVLRSLGRLVRQAGYEAHTFSSAEDFLQAGHLEKDLPSCMLLDLTMPGLDGLELQRILANSAASGPVIFISGHGDIPRTVRAMKQGAVTFLPKPVQQADLLTAIAEALDLHRAELAARTSQDAIQSCINALTEREREVMSWVITGAMNKEIAAELGIVEKTVKVHRAHVMEKMRVRSVAELVRSCVAARFSPRAIQPV